MRDWKSLAKSSGLPAAGRDLDRLTQPLEALEEVFRPLTNDLSPDLEPVLEFRPEASAE